MANVNRKAKWGVRVYIRNCMLSTEFLLPLGSIVTYWLSYKMKEQRVLSVEEMEGEKKSIYWFKHWMIRWVRKNKFFFHNDGENT